MHQRNQQRTKQKRYTPVGHIHLRQALYKALYSVTYDGDIGDTAAVEAWVVSKHSPRSAALHHRKYDRHPELLGIPTINLFDTQAPLIAEPGNPAARPVPTIRICSHLSV